jgi:hypothetical protein
MFILAIGGLYPTFPDIKNRLSRLRTIIFGEH